MILDPNPQPFVDLRRAAVLTGIAPEDLRRLSLQNHLGMPLAGAEPQILFTYDELWRLCVLAAGLEDAR